MNNFEDLPEYKAAVAAYIPFFKLMLKEYKDDILSRDLPDRPEWKELTSDEYAEGIFHDMAVMQAIIDDMVKGRGWE